MSVAAIVTTVIMVVLFVGMICFSFSRMGKGGQWED